MPYPRWVKAASVGRPAAIDWYLRGQLPTAPIRPYQTSTALDVLIAGCGTGQHAIETAQRFAGARVLAIDLSRTSLGYAHPQDPRSGCAQHPVRAGRHPQARLARPHLRRDRGERRAAPPRRPAAQAGACCCRCCGPAASCASGSTARSRAPTSRRVHSSRNAAMATAPTTSAAAGRRPARAAETARR